MKIKYIIGMVLLAISFPAFSQQTDNFLKVGDKLPSSLITNISNYKTNTLRTEDLKGKIFIIDFWAIYCGTCIQALPHLDSLQKEFKNKLFILPVTVQKKDLVLDFVKRIPSLQNLSLPIVTDDTVLRKRFSQIGLPLDVIVDGNGVVKAITDIAYIDSNAIKKLIEGQQIKVSARVSAPDESLETLFLEKHDEVVERNFLLTKYYPGMLSIEGFYKTKDSQKFNGFSGTNIMAIDFFRTALLKQTGVMDMFADNRIHLHVKDTTKLLYPRNLSPEKSDNWISANSYCVNVTVPSGPDSFNEVCAYMKTELEHHFHYRSKLKMEKVKCYILTTLDSSKFISTAGKMDKAFFDQGKSKWSLRKMPIGDLLSTMNDYSYIPIVNETGFTKKRIDIQIKPAINDYKVLREELNKYGLDLLPTKRRLQIMEIRDDY